VGWGDIGNQAEDCDDYRNHASRDTAPGSMVVGTRDVSVVVLHFPSP
jgi:hypothetical protein